MWTDVKMLGSNRQKMFKLGGKVLIEKFCGSEKASLFWNVHRQPIINIYKVISFIIYISPFFLFKIKTVIRDSHEIMKLMPQFYLLTFLTSFKDRPKTFSFKKTFKVLVTLSKDQKSIEDEII